MRKYIFVFNENPLFVNLNINLLLSVQVIKIIKYDTLRYNES